MDKAPRPNSRTRRSNVVPFERPRNMGPRAIADLMPDIGRAAFRRFGFVQSSVVTRWPDIVGTRLAAVTEPEAIRFPRGKGGQSERFGGTLDITISSAHAPMLQHVVPEIIERVNRFFGYAAIAKVRMRQGSVTPRPTKSSEPPVLRPVPVELGDSLRDIGDPELRAVLESLARGLAQSDGPPKVG